MSEWKSIETAPKDGTHVLLASTHRFGTKEIAECSYWSGKRCAEREGGEPEDYSEGWYLVSDDDDVFCRPTHWLSLLDRPPLAKDPTP